MSVSAFITANPRPSWRDREARTAWLRGLHRAEILDPAIPDEHLTPIQAQQREMAGLSYPNPETFDPCRIPYETTLNTPWEPRT